MDEEIKEPGFRFQVLNSRVSVAVSDAHSFGTDAFLLADFAAPRFREPACDLGTGCGIIPLIWARDGKPEFCCGVEIQPLGIRQFEASIAASRLENRVLPVLGDLRELPAELPAGGFGLVTCNPPYKAEHSGILSRSLAEQIARQLDTKVFQSRIRSGVAVAEAPAHGESVLSYAPDSKVARDFRLLLNEITREYGSYTALPR